ncbi:MAG: YihA family ribosome biogenesis GTP-binding protein [Bacteroidales bacterium]|nr:YihA family ribosome biogenesis GTP-binding protein [Bacteroidales bacterium]
MKIKTAEFVISNSDYKKCPKPTLPEYAFIGRSNVGKSSLINMITNQKYLAKISGKPGKTQLINHFIINKSWFLVDLPGYGFAKVSKSMRKEFDAIIQKYLMNRTNLLCTFVLIDSRLEPQNIDLEFLEFMGANQLPFVIIFTKCDKLGPRVVEQNIANYKKVLSEYWEELPLMIQSSAVKEEGREEILEYVDQTNPIFSTF